MKKKLTLLPLLFLFVLNIGHSQSRAAYLGLGDYLNLYVNDNRSNNRYNDYERSQSRRNNDRGRDQYRNDRYEYRSSYRRDHNAYSGMNQTDRKDLRRLEKKFRKRENRAWEDGYLSEHERRRIREVQRDIDRIYDNYYARLDRRNRRSNNRNRWSGCR